MGFPNVRALLASMTSTDLTEWYAFASMEPFGSGHDEHMFGVVASTVANVHRKKGTEGVGPADFFPRLKPKEPDVDAPFDINQALAPFFALGAKDLRSEERKALAKKVH